jgi:ArsR family transcriptional regulator
MMTTLLTKAFKAIANERRLQILGLLSKRKELSVSSIANTLKIPIKTTSFHLLKLESAGLVKKRTDRLWMYYSLNYKEIRFVKRGISKIFGI